MPSRPITAPSGFKGVVRNLKGREGNVLADQAQARNLTTFDTILQNCWLSTEEPGPLESQYFDDDGNIDWGKVYICDRQYILTQIRIATYGENYDFRFRCAGDDCRRMSDWRVVLDKDLKSKALSPETIQTLLKGNRFEGVIPGSDKKFFFSMQTGEGSRTASKRRDMAKDELLTVALAQRITEIEGISKRDRYEFLEDLSLQYQWELIDIMDEVDGGYDDRVEAVCEHCQLEQEIRVPFDDDFWIMSRRRRKGKVHPRDLES